MEPRPAATVIVARPADQGVEVLVLRRAERSGFAPGFVVFPGGTIDTGDSGLAVRLFGDAGQEARACAVRELYEEAGLLLTSEGLVAARGRAPLSALSFDPPLPAALHEVARWVAPEFLEVRFDARFYATEAPGGLEPVPDGAEISAAWWAPPAAVLRSAEEGRTPLMWPTRVTLEALAECTAVAKVLELEMAQVPRRR